MEHTSFTGIDGVRLFKTRLVSAMELRQCSCVSLANQMNLAPNTISSYRTGARLPGVDKLIQLSLILNVSTDYLLGLSDAHERK